MASTTATRVLAPVGTAGKLFAFGLDVGRGLFRRPFQTREFIQQAWFIASVTIIPTALVAIPFGAVIALQVGGLIKQFGAQSFTGSAAVLAVVREAGPIATSLLIAGAGGSAIAADLGARKIREELDAMMVLGIDPIQRLVVPRVLACMLVAFFLNGMVSVVGVSGVSASFGTPPWTNGLVSVVGVAGGYVFNVVLQDGTPGAYLASFTALAQLPDLWQGMAKALIFGLIAAVVACYKGMNAAGGPKGVGDAVNESVVITFMLLFVVNFVMSAIYFQLVPPKTG
ncbi:MAG TPA: ABC transporter permease [Nocardioides sp.]|nr:ABC transporter permease [Nocardioides sp.]